MRRHTTRQRPWSRPRLLVGLLIPVAILASAPATAEGRGRCATVDVPWPVILPDGSTHPACRLTLCLKQIWSPVSGMHELRIDGMPVGLVLSRIGRSEGPAELTPTMLFRRDEREGFRLVGYAWPDGDTMRTYALQAIRRRVPRRDRRPPLSFDDVQREFIQLGARLDP